MARSGFPSGRGVDQLPETAPDARQMAHHLDDSDHRQIFRTDHRLDPGLRASAGPHIRRIRTPASAGAVQLPVRRRSSRRRLLRPIPEWSAAHGAIFRVTVRLSAYSASSNLLQSFRIRSGRQNPANMPSENGRPRTSVDELSRRLRSEMTPINNKFSYYLAFPVAEEDLRQYLQDPVEALPAAVSELLPKIGIVLAPFLERGVGADQRLGRAGKTAGAEAALFHARGKRAISRHCSSPSKTNRFRIITTIFTMSSPRCFRIGCQRRRRTPGMACCARN